MFKQKIVLFKLFWISTLKRGQEKKLGVKDPSDKCLPSKVMDFGFKQLSIWSDGKISPLTSKLWTDIYLFIV